MRLEIPQPKTVFIVGKVPELKVDILEAFREDQECFYCSATFYIRVATRLIN